MSAYMPKFPSSAKLRLHYSLNVRRKCRAISCDPYHKIIPVSGCEGVDLMALLSTAACMQSLVGLEHRVPRPNFCALLSFSKST